MLLTVFLAIAFCAAITLMLLSAVVFIQDKKLFSSAPQEAQEVILIPSALASLLRATAQPSLLESTMIGFSTSSGRKTLSHEAKKLLQSARVLIGESL